MRIRWHAPLDGLFGETSDLALADPVCVRDLLRQLIAADPRFQVYAKTDPSGSRPRDLLVWRRGEILKLEALVEPDDNLEMLILVTGG